MKIAIPKRFRLMGCGWTVQIVPADKWTDDATVGICSFKKCEISLLDRPAEAMEQTFLHECVHASLEAMHSKLYDNEDFVDPLAGLLHQILTSSE